MENVTEYLKLVLEKLRRRIEKIDSSLKEGEREIEQMHNYYWENYTEMDQYGYEEFDNRQALLNQVNANQEQKILRHRFRRMLDSPFFWKSRFSVRGGGRSGDLLYWNWKFCRGGGEDTSDLRLESPGERSVLRL